MSYAGHLQLSSSCRYQADSTRLEAITTCVGFDDMLDVTLTLNHPHLDTMIVVTSHDDRATQQVARKHGAICVLTDLFTKNGRNFNKGAAINAGLGHFQYHGWRLHLDSDIALPDNFRRMLFNHTHLDWHGLYHADRVDVMGRKAIDALRNHEMPQAHHSAVVHVQHGRSLRERYVNPIDGFLPIGYFQLWHASEHKSYPFSLGTAAHDDILFAAQWPREHRHLLPTAIVHHLCMKQPQFGENWDGNRRQPRID